jgi:sugar phosphate isomerase/epimerase
LHDDETTSGVFSLLDGAMDENLGIEIFPLCHIEGYFDRLDKMLPWLEWFPITFHEPYFDADHTYERDSAQHRLTVEYCKRTFEYASILRAKYVAYHLNNREIADREAMLGRALQSLIETAELAKSYGLDLLIENTGVAGSKNVLLGQEDFIALFKSFDCDCLIDVGHANCNDWNLGAVMDKLHDRIRSYHLHNNFGVNDDHNRLSDGTLNLERFFSYYRRYTPNTDVVLEYRPDLLRGNLDWLKDDISLVYDRACASPKTIRRHAFAAPSE